jgi:hypothetical protein
MFSAYVFRALKTPLVHNEFEYDFNNDDNEDTFKDPTWFHLNQIYTILIKLFLSPNFKKDIASLYIDKYFTSKLIDMIDSLNFSERNKAKDLLFYIYEKLVNLRSTIKIQISHVLLV